MDRKMFHDGIVAEGADGPVLIGKKCCRCGKIQFPPAKVCTGCLGTETENIAIGKRGKLFSFTTTYGPTATIQPPFAVGYITTEEGLRIFAPLRMEEGKPFAIGAEMELEIAELWTQGDTAISGYRYRLAE